MKNFFKQTFQPKKDKKEVNTTQNISQEKKNINNNISKNKISNDKNLKENKLKPKISQEIMNANLSLLGHHPLTQNLKNDLNNKDNYKDKEKIILKNIKEKKVVKESDKNKDNNNNKEYKEPYKPLAHYIIDKNLRFEENKSKNKEKINLSNNNNNNNNTEFNSDEEDDLIKSKRKKINLALNQSKKRNKLLQEKESFKKELNSLINDDNDIKVNNNNEKKELRKTNSTNFVRLNLKKKYQEKKRFRPVKLRKIALNHSRELYKYQKKTIKNSSTNYLGKGNQGLDDMDTLIKEQTDTDKNDNNNLLNNLTDKLPVFSQSYILETQKTPIKNDDKNVCKEIIEENNEKKIGDKTPITNRLTTILKNSLRKKVSLDTELKFLSQEFKYLLDGQKDKINKLNEIKHQTLLTKNSLLQEIPEETKEKNEIQITSPIKEELPKEEIDKIETEILTTVLKENFGMEKFASDNQIKCIKTILNTNNVFYISSPGPQQNLVYEYCSILFSGLTIVISPVLPNITQNITTLPPSLKGGASTFFTTPSQKKEIYEGLVSVKNRITSLFGGKKESALPLNYIA